METVNIKVEKDYIGWYAFDSKIGIDFSCENGEDWTSCGSKIGHGLTIQDAIDDFMEQIQEARAAKADPNDDSFVYEIPYNWN